MVKIKIRDFIPNEDDRVRVNTCYPEDVKLSELDFYDRYIRTSYPLSGLRDEELDYEIVELVRDSIFPYNVQIIARVPRMEMNN